MSWLDRLKAHDSAASGLPGDRQNRQNLGFVSIVGAAAGPIPLDEGATRRDPEADREAFEERAAVMEYDGGLSREEVERRAAGAA